MLIVEDDSATAEVLQEYVSYFGITPFVATSISAALEIARREKPKLVYLDVYVGGENSMKSVPAFREILPDAFIALTSARKGVEQESANLPINTYFSKPFGLSMVDKLVDHIA